MYVDDFALSFIFRRREVTNDLLACRIVHTYLRLRDEQERKGLFFAAKKNLLKWHSPPAVPVMTTSTLSGKFCEQTAFTSADFK